MDERDTLEVKALLSTTMISVKFVANRKRQLADYGQSVIFQRNACQIVDRVQGVWSDSVGKKNVCEWVLILYPFEIWRGKRELQTFL